MTVPRLFLDSGSPYAYLAAERAEQVLGVAPAWEPVLLGGIFRATGRSSWSQTGGRADGIAEVERRAAAYGLPPVVWPQPWPGDMLAAMRAATAAAAIGPEAGRAFLLAALRLSFRDGRDLSEPRRDRRRGARRRTRRRGAARRDRRSGRQGRAARAHRGGGGARRARRPDRRRRHAGVLG